MGGQGLLGNDWMICYIYDIYDIYDICLIDGMICYIYDIDLHSAVNIMMSMLSLPYKGKLIFGLLDNLRMIPLFWLVCHISEL